MPAASPSTGVIENVLGMTEFWQHLLIAAVIAAAAIGVAKLVDWRISRRQLAPEVMTRYRVLRRIVVIGIVFIGLMSALLVIPQVRAFAGGILASSAVIGLVIGFAAQRTIGNLVAGISIAITQPLRLGDLVEVQGGRGVVEEIGLTYTWLRTASGDRLVVPNEKLASDTIRNSTIRGRESLAEVTLQVPVGPGLRKMLESLGRDGDEVLVTDLQPDKATVSVRRWVPRAQQTERVASELRLELAERLDGAA
jgi:small-conductance mechanosensitive channel